MPTSTEIKEWLEANGWKEWPVHAKLDKHDFQFFKRFPGVPRCQCNTGKDLSIGVYGWEHGDGSAGVELHLRAQPYGHEEWVDLMIYSIDSVHRIPQLCEQLLRAWEAINRS